MGKLAKSIRDYNLFGAIVYYTLLRLKIFFSCEIFSAKYVSKRKFEKVFAKELNLENPKTLNEKMQWLKLYEKNDFTTALVDKYVVREYLKDKFGGEYLIPLLFQTTNYRDIIPQNVPDIPCIIKSNHNSGTYQIIRDKSKVDFCRLRVKCRFWLSYNYYNCSKEWQYKNIKPRRLIIEQLLETKEGKIPNDYKLHYIAGELQFVYVSFDREGVNDRCMYDKDWNRLPFVWVPANTYRSSMNTSVVPCPKSFEKMKEFGAIIAKDFKYVRVDFYDVDGRLYFGEITLHHGGGTDKFFPEEYDEIYGNKLNLFD